MKVGAANGRKRLASLVSRGDFETRPKVDKLVLTCALLKQGDELVDNGDA
jgi:hypothetical protein